MKDINKDQKDLVIENLLELIKRLKLELEDKDDYASQLEAQLQLVKKRERTNFLRPKSTSDYDVKELDKVQQGGDARKSN